MAFYAVGVFKDGAASPRGSRVVPNWDATLSPSDLRATSPADGRTALHFAAGRGHALHVRVLVHAAGLALDARDADGATPLHRAVVNNRPDMVRELARVVPVAVAGEGGWSTDAPPAVGSNALFFILFIYFFISPPIQLVAALSALLNP
jgi:hypothetical protein